MLAEDFDLLTRCVEHAFDGIGSNVPTDAPHRDWRERVRDHDVSHQGECFVANYNVPRFGDKLQTRCEISFCTDDRIVHPIGATEIPNIAKASIDANSDAEGVFHSLVPPFCVQFGKTMLHFSSHAQTSLGVLRFSLRFRIAEKDQNGIPDKLVDCATMLERDVGHLSEILIEEPGDLLRLQAFCGRRKVLDVGKEDCKFLALGVYRNILLTAKDTLVNLRREVA